MLPSINNERDEDILEASVSQEFIMVNQDRLGEVVGSTAATGTNMYKGSYNLA